VEHTEYQMQAIRQRYDNSAGQTARTCPTVWVEKLPAFIKASTMLLIEENRHLENSLKTKV
jgi:hypothetical protein